MRSHREIAGLTQRQLADRAGISLGALEDIEQGRTVRPRRDSLARLGAALRLTAEQLGELTGASPGTPGNGRLARASKPPGAGLCLAVLGPLAAWSGGLPLDLGPERERAVLGLLALHAGTPLQRAAIIDALWGEDPPPTAVTMVQAQISGIRRRLSAGPPEGALLSWTGAGYRLSHDGLWLDRAEFDALTRRARDAVAAGDATAACALYERALGLWRGRPLEDIEVLYGHPVVTGLARHRDAVVLEYADAAAGAGLCARATVHLEELATRDPLDERAHARLIIALAATGQQAAALRVYRELAARLDAELGMRPGPELAEAHLRVLRQQVPSALAGTRPRDEGTGPQASGGFQDHGGPGISPGPAECPAGPTAPRTAAAVAVTASTPVAVRQLPAAAPYFVGRFTEIAALTGLLERGAAAVAIAAISGTAGAGKTALAVHWAHGVSGRFPDGQLYVNLRGFGPAGAPMAPEAALRLLLEGLGAPAGQIPPGLDAQAARYRSLLAGKRVLIVLDNARDPEQVRPLLPGTPGCMALVTSRNQLIGLAAGHGALLLALDVLTEAEACELLETRLGRERAAGEPAAVTELGGLCARLPLALNVAAARAAATPGRALAALATELRGAVLDGLRTADAATDVRAVFSWSCRQLSGPAARMFCLLGLHPGPDIALPAAASLAGWQPGRARQALAELAAAHLVAQQPAGRYALHDLLRAYTAERARELPEAEWRAAMHRMLDHYLHAAHAAAMLLDQIDPPTVPRPPVAGVIQETPADRDQAYAWFAAERPVLPAVIAQAARCGFDTHAWQLPQQLREFYHRRAHPGDGIAAHRIALAAAGRAGNRAAQAAAHRFLGSAHHSLELDDDAREHFLRALDLYRGLGDQLGEGRTHFFLALIRTAGGDHSAALIHARRARRLLRAHGRPGDEAHALNAIALSQTRLGNDAVAQACSERALDLHRRAGTRLGEALTLQLLGRLRSRAGHHGEAVTLLRQAIGLCRETGDRLYLADMLDDLGDIHRAAGELPAACRSWRGALVMLESHPRARQVRAKLAAPRGPEGLGAARR